jgi:DNA-binding GntR family transcriptional regulator
LLATRLGMSKTPVRSAVERLETAGFVTVSPQQGILVKALSLDEIIDHFEIRVALETFMMRRLAGQLTAEQDERLESNLQRQLVAAEAGDLATYGQLDPELHQIFCESLGNDEITKVMLRLRDKLHRIVSRVIEAHPDRMLSSSHEHVAIVEALRAGDGETAAARMEEHLAWGRRFLATR